jgi:hypothetical protein
MKNRTGPGRLSAAAAKRTRVKLFERELRAITRATKRFEQPIGMASRDGVRLPVRRVERPARRPSASPCACVASQPSCSR